MSVSWNVIVYKVLNNLRDFSNILNDNIWSFHKPLGLNPENQITKATSIVQVELTTRNLMSSLSDYHDTSINKGAEDNLKNQLLENFKITIHQQKQKGRPFLEVYNASATDLEINLQCYTEICYQLTIVKSFTEFENSINFQPEDFFADK